MRPEQHTACAAASIALLVATAGLCGAPAYAQPTAPATGPAPTTTTPPGGPPPGGPSPGAEAGMVKALEPFENRVIREVSLVGVRPEDEQLVRNQVRSMPGQPLSRAVVEADIQRMVRLGRFRQLSARVEPFDDGTVRLVFDAQQTQVIRGVDVVGNRQISNEELRSEVNLLAGTPVDRFQIDRTLRRIKDLYQRKGYYQADVTIDEKELTDNGVILFRIREGDRLRVTDIRFEGNHNIPSRSLRRELATETVDIFKPGTLDDNTLEQDVATVTQFYKDRGFLDVRVDRRVQPAPNAREAIVTFVIEEGRLYHLRSVRFELDTPREDGSRNPTVFTLEQVAALLPIKPGDVYSLDKLRQSIQVVNDAYGRMGYADVRVGRVEVRDVEKPEVDLLIVVSEGRQFRTGLVTVRGNDITQDKVVRREVRVKPDHPLDTAGIRETELRLREASLYDPAAIKVTVQPEDAANPDVRDVLVQVGETNTGSLGFGAAVSSDGGLLGSINLKQRNFDVADWPESFEEFIRGRAFRGAGQDLSIAAQPGTTFSSYLLSLSDPHLFDTDVSGSGAVYYRTSDYDQWDEKRVGTAFNVGRRFGDIWVGALTVRAERVEISNVPADSAIDIFNDQGTNNITGIGLRMQRQSTDSNFRPSKGTRLTLAVEQVGLLGGDYDFTKLTAEYFVFVPVHEDFLGRKTILTLRTAVGYIPQGRDETPVYERFYLGGRDFRGFGFRTISPRVPRADNPALISDDPVGGTWSFLASAQVEHPIWQQFMSVVGFIDTGTVTFEPGFDDYRVSVGMGIRIYLPALGPAPLAFDFGFPLLKQDLDDERLFSFSIDVPF